MECHHAGTLCTDGFRGVAWRALADLEVAYPPQCFAMSRGFAVRIEEKRTIAVLSLPVRSPEGVRRVLEGGVIRTLFFPATAPTPPHRTAPQDSGKNGTVV